MPPAGLPIVSVTFFVPDGSQPVASRTIQLPGLSGLTL
jgi:hypothetical protein